MCVVFQSASANKSVAPSDPPQKTLIFILTVLFLIEQREKINFPKYLKLQLLVESTEEPSERSSVWASG